MNLAQLALQAVPPAASPAPASAPAQATEGAASGAPPAPGLMTGLFPLLIFVPLILVLFWQSSSQRKKEEAAIGELKKGDRVLTKSGLVGRLTDDPGPRYARVEIAAGVKIQVLRNSLAGRDSEDGSADPKK